MRALRLFLLLIPGLLWSQSLADFEKKVTTFTLDNGLTFVIIERRDAPVVSFHTYVNAGAVDDPKGATGLAHMFEHMAFKGTPQIGSKNWTAEKKALDRIEQVYDRLEAEKNKGYRANPDTVKALEAELKDAIASADAFVEPNAFDRIVESNGGVGLNASTGVDATQYFYSLPSNRLELWFLLESERFLRPVLREFYKERDVVREERRMRIESSPQGQLLEALLATSFDAHPYQNSPAGWGSDIESFRATDAEAFFKTHYVPSNLTIAIAGDVDPAKARQFAQRYFGRLPKAPTAPMVTTKEPIQRGEKRQAIASPAQPLLLMGYHRPDQYSADSAALDVLYNLLTGGRTGWMYTDMVRDKQIALAVDAAPAFPGAKYPNLFVLLAIPSPGKTVEENEKAMDAIIERAKTEKADQATLDRIKTKLRAGVIRSLTSNAGVAQVLASYQANFGDWRRLFTELDDLEKVTADDVQRVAKAYLNKEQRTVVYSYVPQGGQQ